MANLTLLGLNSGSTTLAPTDGANATLTLPTGTGTVVTTANPQSGAVIQTVQTYSITQISTASSSFVTSGIAASITPRFSTSKILISVQLPTYCSSSAGQCVTTIYRGSTNLSPSPAGTYQGFGQSYIAGAGIQCNHTFSFLDSPATTSSTTYTIYYASVNGGSAYICINQVAATLILQEIAA